jgi:ribonuclease Z
MRTLFHPFLPNGPFGDPAVWIDLLDEGRSVLLDLGDLRAIPNRKLLRVDRVVVTHAHMDHFIGFDQLLRLVLVRERELAITGPAGFIDRVRGRIDGYTWNVIRDYPVRLRVEEIEGEVVRAAAFTGAGGMRPEPLGERPFDGTVAAHPAYRIRVAVLDHGVPVLAVALDEVERLAVDADRVARMGLRPGAWLRRLKEVVRAAGSGATPIEAETADGGTRTLPAGELEREMLKRAPGQTLAYVTDVRGTARNLERAAGLARGADLLICEAAFLHADAALAAERGHLTARQAGELARAAGARRLAPTHFSARYGGRESELLEEAAAAFGGTIVELPSGAPDAGGHLV